MSDVYERLLNELSAGEMSALQRKVFDLLRDYPKGYTRRELVYAIYGYMPTDLQGNVDDRKIRKAIEGLRARLVPIVSSSGSAGYRLDASREAVRRMLAELISRRDKIQAQINAAAKFYNIPEFYDDPRRAKQLDFAKWR